MTKLKLMEENGRNIILYERLFEWINENIDNLFFQLKNSDDYLPWSKQYL